MCEHLIAYFNFWGNSVGVFTEQEIYDIMKDSVYNEWVYSHIIGEEPFNYNKKEFFDNNDTIDYCFFDFCPDCGLRIGADETFNKLNDRLSKYAKSLKNLPEPETPSWNSNKKKEIKEHKELSKGCVYLVKLGKHYKIGISKNPKDRLKEFTLLPYELEEIIVKEVNNYELVEEKLHTKYKDFRVRGEWFELSLEQVEEIKQYLENLSNSQIKME